MEEKWNKRHSLKNAHDKNLQKTLGVYFVPYASMW